MTEKNRKAQQADQGVQDEQKTGEQSEIEKQRLANLKASGQLQEGQEPQQDGTATQEGQSK